VAGTVFITQENPKVDTLSARAWGHLDLLTSSFDQVHLDPGRIVSQMRRKLRHYNDEDWLLALGDPAIIGIAFAIASESNSGRINLLKWDKREKTYYPVNIKIRGGIGEFENLTRKYVDE
tara:strand:+ start:154 stop:513 length:360 start_codon:yes stop_codon:yes gene_type:complete